ncbi:MAG TPA: TonB-dependent receptor plug domain-containing protein, partial [Segetibacter sp.]|nr:TonB-dependent receptor plug domain-containing protein [Segetibacter sp.]
MSKFFMYHLYISVMVITGLDLSAQNKTITGTVRDAVTLQPVIGNSISLLGSTRGTTGNSDGKFILAIPSYIASSGRIAVSSLGYASDTIQISSSKNHFDILLRPMAGALGDVVVTGVSKATLIRENPVPVSVVSTKKIEQSAENNIIDVFAKNVPGLNAVKTGPNISKPFIRGLGYNRVLTLYDGVRQEGQQWGDEHGLEVDAFNIEKGEVIKGPSSLIYGSDAMAGVVSLLPAMPQHTDKKVRGKYFSEYQTNNGLYGNGLRLTYGGSSWSMALRGSYRIAKNYTNSIDGRVYNTGFRETNASASIKHIGDKGSSVLNFTIYDNLQGVPDGSRDSLTRKFTKQIFEGNADDVTNRPVVSQQELNSYKLSPLHQHIQHYRLYTNNHYQLGKGDIDFLLGVQQNVRREYNHPTAPQQPGMYIRLNTMNYALSYNAPTISNIDFTVGLNGMYQNDKNKSATDFPIPDYHLFDAGGYIHAKWKQKNWTVSGGLRADTRILSGGDFYTKKNASTGFDQQIFPPDTAGAYLHFLNFRKNF